jgi:hypothetical protein
MALIAELRKSFESKAGEEKKERNDDNTEK